MSLLGKARTWVGDLLAIQSMRRHRSRLGRRLAPAYTRYWQHCRNAFKEAPVPTGVVADAVAVFCRDGVASFSTAETERVANAMYEKITKREAVDQHMWTTELGESGNLNYTGDVWRDFPEVEDLFKGPLGVFLTGYFQSHFKIFYGTLYKSVGIGMPRRGSQCWHSDGGPGSCVIVMFYLHETDEGSGPIEVLPWEISRTIFERERKALRHARKTLPPGSTKTELRHLMSNFYEAVIAQDYAGRMRQPLGPAGLVVPFINNNLHRGGYPAKGRVRYAIVFHCYPSDRPADFARYEREGVRKTTGYPMDPAAVF